MQNLGIDPIAELANYLNVPASYLSLFAGLLVAALLLLILLKGAALWRSARNGQKVWFWVFVFINTLGILEIIYLLVVKAKKCSHDNGGKCECC
ncbi:hypothetical protein HYV44_00495 [Candidatus Microgenomates bacterium]|nr:hypothetical protein [Candidatus Microgenomates bacterium]